MKFSWLDHLNGKYLNMKMNLFVENLQRKGVSFKDTAEQNDN